MFRPPSHHFFNLMLVLVPNNLMLQPNACTFLQPNACTGAKIILVLLVSVAASRAQLDYGSIGTGTVARGRGQKSKKKKEAPCAFRFPPLLLLVVSSGRELLLRVLNRCR